MTITIIVMIYEAFESHNAKGARSLRNIGRMRILRYLCEETIANSAAMIIRNVFDRLQGAGVFGTECFLMYYRLNKTITKRS